jgi:hypothetical protein
MSLCGLCRLPGWQIVNTCSVDDQTFYCVKCVWAKVATLQLKPRLISTEELKPLQDIEWGDGARASDIIAEKTGPHWTRIEKADLAYPIIVMLYHGKLEIVDGRHRLSKIHLQKLESAMCIEVSPEQLTDCIFYAIKFTGFYAHKTSRIRIVEASTTKTASFGLCIIPNLLRTMYLDPTTSAIAIR